VHISSEILIALIGYAITMLSYIIYAFIRFSRLENEVSHLIKDFQDVQDLKKMVYKIYAQNDLLLHLKKDSSISV